MTDIYFFDTDCLSSFLMTNNESLILDMYPGKIILPSFVYSEALKKPGLKEKVTSLVNEKKISLFTIEYNSPEYKEYVHLTEINYSEKVIGKGEAAAIACVKCNGGILASNNFKDVLYYIDKYNLEYTTTSDILLDAFDDKVITLEDANNIWKQMLDIGNYMPYQTFTEYLKSNR